jgi:hypothetical protein
MMPSLRIWKLAAYSYQLSATMALTAGARLKAES